MKFSELITVSGEKFVAERVKKCGLPSQKKIPYFKSRQILAESGFVLSEKSRNCIFPNGGSETVKHWVVKCLIFKILRDRGREVSTEVEVRTGIVDVLDVTNMIVYEIETNLTKKKIVEKLVHFENLKDVFFIDTREVPNDLHEAEKYLQEKVV